MKNIRPVIKTCDEKWSIREWILSKFPENYEEMTYVEPFGGGINMLFSKNKSVREIINDKDVDVLNIYRAVRDEPLELIRKANLFKHSQEDFEKIEKRKQFEDYLDQAVNDLLLRRTSKNGLKKSYIKTANIKSWKDSISLLSQNSERLREVFILNKSAIESIKAFDAEDTLLYCDPPYLHDTKVSKLVYDSEIKPEDHIELHQVLNDFSGKIILSGCISPLYKRLYKNWNMSKKRINTTKDKRTEIIWTNF